MQKEEYIKLAKEYSNKLKKHPKIELILIHGSVAEGLCDKYSDIDVQIYTKKMSMDDVKDVLNMLGVHAEINKFQLPFWNISLTSNKTKVSLSFNPISVFDSIPANNDNLDPVLDYPLQKNIVSFIINAIVLYDKNKFLKRFSKLKELPKNFKQHILTFDFNRLDWPFYAVNLEIMLKRKDKINIIRFFERANSIIFKVLFALNNRFVLNEKWVKKQIDSFKIKPVNCTKKLEKIMCMGFEPSFNTQAKKKFALYKKFSSELKPFVKKRA